MPFFILSYLRRTHHASPASHFLYSSLNSSSRPAGISSVSLFVPSRSVWNTCAISSLVMFFFNAFTFASLICSPNSSKIHCWVSLGKRVKRRTVFFLIAPSKNIFCKGSITFSLSASASYIADFFNPKSFISWSMRSPFV